jgi:hypothetical protein
VRCDPETLPTTFARNLIRELERKSIKKYGRYPRFWKPKAEKYLTVRRFRLGPILTGTGCLAVLGILLILIVVGAKTIWNDWLSDLVRWMRAMLRS